VFSKPNRIYAVTGRNKPIAAVFVVIAVSQFGLGIYLTFLTATHPGRPRALSGSLVSPF